MKDIRQLITGLPVAMWLPELHKLAVAGGAFAAQDIAAHIGTAAKGAPFRASGSVAIIPVLGIISPRVSQEQQALGMGTNTTQLANAVRQATAAKGIDGIVMIYDTPGGSTQGLQGAAQAIADAGSVKPVVAHAELLTASAGYWLAAQATTLNVGESARSGSIGVYMVHDEISGMMEKEGVKRTYIYEGDRKVLGNEAEPLSADAKKYFQAEVSREMQSFVDAVATGRGVDESTVRGESFGQGQTVPADAALAAGMVDSVGTLSQAMQELSQAAAGTRNTAQDLAIMERSLALLQLRSKAKC